MTQINIQKARALLEQFQFMHLFIEQLGWNNPPSPKPIPLVVEDKTYTAKPLAEIGGHGGIIALQVFSPDGELPDRKTRLKIHQEAVAVRREHLLIFTDGPAHGEANESIWSWVKEGNGKKQQLRSHHYARWQDPTLHLGKISGLFVAMSDLDAEGHLPLVEATHRLSQSLDIEQVTKKFYTEFQTEHDQLMAALEPSIANEKDRRWYTSVLLNRIMFIYFVQKQHFVDKGNLHYLRQKLQDTPADSQYYRDFLLPLFFEGFALPAEKRSPQSQVKLGDIPYLNGGLFLQHPMEIKYAGQINLPNEAFAALYQLLDSYTWHLDDRPGQNPQEINPDVLGYIFEKYINQKAFGAYYTRPEITLYLCEQTIQRLVLEKMREIDENNFGLPPLSYDTLPELLNKIDAKRNLILLRDILPKLSLLDPACGSGAFLVAAMKTLTDIYQHALGRATTRHQSDPTLQQFLGKELEGHANHNYYIKKKIITHNLFGVDIMDEAVEIARLRLFLDLVSTVKEASHLEPLPNIDFNILPGNSLIGLLRVDEAAFNQHMPPGEGDLEQKGFWPFATIRQSSMFTMLNTASYRQMVNKKNELVRAYRFADTLARKAQDGELNLIELRQAIEGHRAEAQKTLNAILLDEFGALGIKYEQATWDKAKNKLGKPQKRPLTLADMAALQPFHWGYEFDEVMNERGGFDAVITNPPWEALKPQAKEFFADYSDAVSRNRMTIQDFEEKQTEILANPEIQKLWLEFLGRFPYQSKYFGESSQYQHQRTLVNDQTTPGDVNLYKLFTEQGYNLLRQGGLCGTVIPSGIYTDLGATGLRKLLFEKTEMMGLFGFENRRNIFEGVDSRFKFVVLTFRKGGATTDFPAAFMRHEVGELDAFPNEKSLNLPVSLVKNLSPDSFSVTEFKDQADIDIAKKLMVFPLLHGDPMGWQLEIYGEELHMNRGSHYFKTKPTATPLYEGRMIWHFDHRYAQPRYWLDESELRHEFLGKRVKRIPDLKILPTDLKNDYETYRLALRKIASNTNERTLITTVIPKHVVTGNSLAVHFPFVKHPINYNQLQFSFQELLVIVSILNSFVTDYILRARMTTNLNSFYLYQLPIPKLIKEDSAFGAVVKLAAQLICTTPAFDGLAQALGYASAAAVGVTDPAARAALRAQLDGLIAHVYGLDEAEFQHILSTFPLVAQEVKTAALEAYKNLVSLRNQVFQMAALIAGGERDTVEFKSGAYYNPFTKQPDSNKMSAQVLGALAAFLNSHKGGTLFLGVADDGTVLGLEMEYALANKQKPGPDSYELALRNMVKQRMGAHFAHLYTFAFGRVSGQEVAQITIQPAPEPVYLDGELYIRVGNGKQKLTAQEALSYIAHRWPK